MTSSITSDKWFTIFLLCGQEDQINDDCPSMLVLPEYTIWKIFLWYSSVHYSLMAGYSPQYCIEVASGNVHNGGSVMGNWMTWIKKKKGGAKPNCFIINCQIEQARKILFCYY